MPYVKFCSLYLALCVLATRSFSRPANANSSPCRFVNTARESAYEYERTYVCANALLPRLDVTSHVGRLRLVNMTIRRAEYLAAYANRQEDLRVFEVSDSRIQWPASSATVRAARNASGGDEPVVNLQLAKAASGNLERIALSNLSCVQCALTVTVSTLANLRSLSLRNVSLAEESGNGLVLQALPSLSVLTVERSGLRKFDAQKVDLETRGAPVSFLFLSGNRLESVVMPGNWLTRLTVLDVSDNRLAANSVVRMLNDSRRDEKVASTANVAFAQLRQVRISENQLVDADVGALVAEAKRLETLDAAFNALTGRFAMPYCDLLLTLNLSHNAMTRLPLLGDAPGGCESLQTLDLSHNSLRRLDALYCKPTTNLVALPSAGSSDDAWGPEEHTVCQYPVLRRLIVAYNAIETVAESFVRSIASANFRELDLRGNKIALFTREFLLSSDSIEPCAVNRVFLQDNEQLARQAVVTFEECEVQSLATADSDDSSLVTISSSASSSTSVSRQPSSTIGVASTRARSAASSKTVQVTNRTATSTSTASTSQAITTSTSGTSRSTSSAAHATYGATVQHSNDTRTSNSSHTSIVGLSETSTTSTVTLNASHSSSQPEETHNTAITAQATPTQSTVKISDDNANPVVAAMTNAEESNKTISNEPDLSPLSFIHSFATRNPFFLLATSVALLGCLLISLVVILALALRLRKRKRSTPCVLTETRMLHSLDKPKAYSYSQLDECATDSNSAISQSRHLIVNMTANTPDSLKNERSASAKPERRAFGTRNSRADKRLCPGNEYTTRTKLLAHSNWSVRNILLGLPPGSQGHRKAMSRTRSEVELDSTMRRYPSDFWVSKAADRSETDL